MGLHHVRQMQAYLLDEAQSAAHEAIELRASGRAGKASRSWLGIAVEIPFAREACPAGEDSEGGDLAGTQGRIGSGVLFLQAGLAEVVDHNVKCGEEGVHVEHESRFLSLRERVGKPTLMGGRLPLKFRRVIHTKRLRVWPLRGRCLRRP